MRHLRMVGVCLAAVFAITAITATGASALPEWGKCEKLETKTGAYTDANCTVKAKPKLTGEYKWVKGKELANVPFTGKNVGSGGVLYSQLWYCNAEEKITRVSRANCASKGGEYVKEVEATIECATEANTGEATGTNKIAHVHVKFTGCLLFGSFSCSNTKEPGEINVNLLKGQLGYINKPGKVVGVLLTPEKAKGDFATFNCGGAERVVVGVGNVKEGAWYEPEKTGGYDGIISPIEPVNVMTSKYKQVFTINPATDENIPSKFEGKHIELLESFLENEENSFSFLWGPAGEEITNENTAAEEGEIKA